MTYQEKYTEIYKAYEQATKVLHDATQKISFTNGFGDATELGEYFKAQKAYRFAEREFHQLLKYATSRNLNPESEYLPFEFMYNVIKEDQKRKGTPWTDVQVKPEIGNGVKGYEANIRLTNNGEINRMIQGTEYIFPVVDLNHGKEAYDYFAKMLQNGGGEGFDVNNLKLDDIDASKPIFVKVTITVWLN